MPFRRVGALEERLFESLRIGHGPFPDLFWAILLGLLAEGLLEERQTHEPGLFAAPFKRAEAFEGGSG